MYTLALLSHATLSHSITRARTYRMCGGLKLAAAAAAAIGGGSFLAGVPDIPGFDHVNKVLICTNDCVFARNGMCEDGGPGTPIVMRVPMKLCDLGTDCADCPMRYVEPDDKDDEKKSIVVETTTSHSNNTTHIINVVTNDHETMNNNVYASSPPSPSPPPFWW